MPSAHAIQQYVLSELSSFNFVTSRKEKKRARMHLTKYDLQGHYLNTLKVWSALNSGVISAVGAFWVCSPVTKGIRAVFLKFTVPSFSSLTLAMMF